MSIGIASSYLLIAAIITLLMDKFATTSKIRSLLLITFACLLPIFDMPAPLYIRGAIGDLSLVSQCILAAYLLNYYVVDISHLAKTIAKKQFAVYVLMFALALYPASLGLSLIDPYEAGYASSDWHFVLFSAACAAAIFFYRPGSQLFTFIMLASTTLFWLNALESTNYWDYLLDPVITILALGYLVVRLIKNK